MAAELTVVLCTLNGRDRIGPTLDALERQTARDRMTVLVVDDGSSDGGGDHAAARGHTVVRHPENRGLSAARNTGVRAARTPLVAFLDDDCVPADDWAELLLGARGDGVIGVSGPVVPVVGGSGYLSRYVARNNRHLPLELELTVSQAPHYRLWLYLRRLWRRSCPAEGRRDIYCPTGGNMAFERAALDAVGGFDERFRFGSEEEDMVRRMRRDHPGRIVFLPEAAVTHAFAPTWRSLLRRSVAYGRGNALQFRKWPSVNPTLFPWPFGVALPLLAAPWWPPLLAVALLAPLALYPAGVRGALALRRPEPLADAYVQLLQEACENHGFVTGAHRFRRIRPEPKEAAR
ncbi:glycosyltransferase [Actinocorallia sp. API 0066]|uniref:glycosyltransferase family 2 protein n=1 Tax=Actinocorallia sp. API 0066 TaxID=2896846 RepID=UPI001E3C0F03|nr:glycosyltransferase [Actinocorallia sp. API 0066]MCD0450133.1 glycosyltransferase [Actinocorallia sp. API 0066]